MKFNGKHIAIAAGLGVVLATSQLVGPVGAAYAAENAADETVEQSDATTAAQAEETDASQSDDVATQGLNGLLGNEVGQIHGGIFGTVIGGHKVTDVDDNGKCDTCGKKIPSWQPSEEETAKEFSGTVYFYVDDQCYTITLTNNYGSSFSEYVDQLEKDYPEATVKDGYSFQGWVDENGKAVDNNLVITNADNSSAPATLTVKASFKQNEATHTVNFYDENGKCVCTTAKSGDQPLSEYISMLQQSGFDTSREGYGLTWTTKSGDEVLESDIVSGDLNLYARWDAIHTVNFFDKDGKGLGTIALAGDKQLSAYTDKLAEGVEVPYVDGYTFTGWATKSGDAVLSTDTISVDLNLYAQYEKSPAIYTVNFFDQNGKGLCTVALAGDHALQDFIDTLYETDGVEVPFKDGCSIEWVTKSGDVVLPTDVIQGTINLYVSFKQAPATHTINFFDADGNGLATIAKSGEQAFSVYTDALAESGIEAPYKEGYTFTGWATKSGDAILSSDVIAGDINVYATYQKNAAIHTVNFFDEDGNGICTTTNEGDVAFSEYVNKLLEVTEIPAKDGYIFSGWVTASGDKILNSDVISGDINVYASYEKVETPATQTHKVTFDDCLDSTENQVVEVEDGAAVAKPADPVCKGWKFLGWYSDTALTEEYDFSAPVTSDMTLYAKWQKDETSTGDTTDEGTDNGTTAETPTTPTEEAKDAKAMPQTGDFAGIATAVTGIAGAGLAGIGAFLGKKRRK